MRRPWIPRFQWVGHTGTFHGVGGDVMWLGHGLCIEFWFPHTRRWPYHQIVRVWHIRLATYGYHGNA